MWSHQAEASALIWGMVWFLQSRFIAGGTLIEAWYDNQPVGYTAFAAAHGEAFDALPRTK